MKEEHKAKNAHTSKNLDEERQAHMFQRNRQGVSVRDIAEEFNTSKSAVHRAITWHEQRILEKLAQKVK